MSKLYAALAVFAVLNLTGCAGFAFMSRQTATGAIYADTKANEKVTDNAIGSKNGEACATSILGLVTTGDASVASAAKAGGITKVSTVDHKFTNIVGVIATYCVQVTGE